MSELPRRPFTPEMPPPEGLNSVRYEAARRRRARVIRLTAGGAATAAAAAVVVTITGATGGADTLQPLPPAVQPTSRPVATATLSPPAAPPPITTSPDSGHARTSAGPQPVVTATIGPETDSGDVAPARPASERQSQPSPRDASRGDAPRMTRYRSTYYSPAGARVCGGGSSSDDQGVHNGVGWCPSVIAKRVSDGVRLTFQICRDATGGGRLNFATSREVSLVLRRNGETVWSWARVVASHPDSHALSAPANGCWNWTLVWPGNTSAGKAAPHGTYSLTGASTAQEVYPDKAKASFAY